MKRILIFAGNHAQADNWAKKNRITNYRSVNSWEHTAGLHAGLIEKIVLIGEWWRNPAIEDSQYLKDQGVPVAEYFD